MIKIAREHLGVILFLFFGLGGVILVWHASRHHGIGISPDSAFYIEAGNNFAAGRELVITFSSNGIALPLEWFPPLYPLLISVFSMAGCAAETATRWMSAACFAATILFSMGIMQSITRSLRAAIVAGTLILFSTSIVMSHCWAWSEPPFILFMLIGFAFLGLAISRQNRAYLVFCGIFVGLSYLTRYAGICLFPTCLLVIAFFQKCSWRRRLADILCFLVFSCSTAAIWNIRNLALGIPTMGRSIGFHPATLKHLRLIFQVLSEWFLASRDLWILMVVILLAVLAIIVVKRKALLEHLRNHPAGGFLSACLIFSLLYIPFIIASVTFADATIAMDNRIFSPMAAPLFLFLTAFGYEAFSRGNPYIRMILTLSLAIVVAGNMVNTARYVQKAHLNGLGYKTKKWRESRLIEAIRKMPPGTLVFSDCPDAVYVLTGRNTRRLPSKTEVTDAQIIENLLDELKKTKDSVFIYFNMTARTRYPSKDEMLKIFPLEAGEPYPDGVMLIVRPDAFGKDPF